MSYVPKLAIELQSFPDVKELNKHMNFHFVHIKSVLTECFDKVFHLLKKYSCKVPGVCWIKQEKIADLLNISIKTVERAIKFLKENRILKIHHTKRGNLNGNSYYVLQPCTRFLEEEVLVVEEVNVGTGEVLESLEAEGLRVEKNHQKLFESSIENSNINSEKLHLSKVQNFITKNQSRIKKRRIDIKCIWDVYDMQLVMNENIFIIVLDRVIDQYKTNFKSCLQRALLNETEEAAKRLPVAAKPIREERIPNWYYNDNEETIIETIRELEENYQVLLKEANQFPHHEELQQQIQEVQEKIEKQANYEAKKAEVEERLKKYRNLA